MLYRRRKNHTHTFNKRKRTKKEATSTVSWCRKKPQLLHNIRIRYNERATKTIRLSVWHCLACLQYVRPHKIIVSNKNVTNDGIVCLLLFFFFWPTKERLVVCLVRLTFWIALTYYLLFWLVANLAWIFRYIWMWTMKYVQQQNNMQHITNSTYTRLEADMQWNVVSLTSSSLGRCLSGTTKLDDGSSIF